MGSSLFDQWRIIEEIGLSAVVRAREYDVLKNAGRKTFSWVVETSDAKERFRQTIFLADELMRRCKGIRLFTFPTTGLVSGYFTEELWSTSSH